MATVAAVYTVEPFVRQPEDVVRVLAPSDEREKDKNGLAPKTSVSGRA